MQALQDWLLALGSSPWIYLALFAFCMVDGFFPPVPSETVVIALAAGAAAVGAPNVLLVVLFACLGAFVGDQIAYTLGRRVRVRDLRMLRGAKGQAAVDGAERALATRGPSFIIAARYVPIGRVAVNMTAGSLHYPRARYTVLVLVSGLLWALYGTAIGYGAGRWFQDRPVAAVVVGVLIGIVVGLLVDPVIRRFSRGSTASHGTDR